MDAAGDAGTREATGAGARTSTPRTEDGEVGIREPDAPDEPRGSGLDRWWARMLSTPGRRRAWTWAGPIAVTLLAGILRFWNLGHPHALVFDETYYVKDAWTLLHLGYEATWPDDANASFEAGDTDVFGSDPSYVVHPPLGKWMIGLGMAAFGAGDAFWWRATTALAGTLAVLILTLVARRLFGQTALAVVAGLLLAVDGHAIVLSRVALLDTWVMFFALLGFWFVLLDRRWSEERLRRRVDAARASGADPGWGPALWARPWVFAAGAAFGATAAVKWSGLYFLAAFGVYLVVVDALARRRAGLPFWASAAILKQGPVTVLLYLPVALVVYLASWTGWFATEGGYDRHWAEDPANAAGGLFAWVPTALQSLWHYHSSAYDYHIGVHSPHPWQAAPWSWLLMIRPTNMYFHTQETPTCGAGSCVESIMGIGNPLIWWAAAAAVLYLVYRLARYREWRVGLILMGLVAGYLPWLMYSERTVFQFYTIAFQPYTILALVFVIGLIVGRPTDPEWRRTRGLATVGVFLTAVLLVTLFFYPVWAAIPVPPLFRQLHFWLPTWG
ncbi:dolichyl-phosphate-mannose--protein mannosyltransferase [Agromyces archimandritae]|uniref:Polyprenol-phosphate-mannose--protein mannosyltransferase n=1 Tax=Agromyces archimandritae TaxID=2781962 RepID=A0A975FLH1_9MICO|nr:phospholipid carrier-dependent glycosyltransferase [Agromyces archimandritae]QTX04092.1 phospholipid carrier-dependent glycosyltransferase [Agromyces archimandritae]